MSKRTTGFGHIYEASGAWHTRFTIGVKNKRVQRSLRICSQDGEHPSKESVVQLATDLVKQAQAHAANQEQIYNTGQCPTCGRFTKASRENTNA